jgi:hypothetical protein
MVEDDGAVGSAGRAVMRAARGGRAGSVRWSEALGRRICARVAAGEVLYAVLRGEGMPSAQSVAVWARARADFAEALMEARRAGGRPARGGGGVWTYCEETAHAIFERLCEGESLTAIGRDPTMPSLSTIFYWRRRIPEFAETVRVAKEIQAERFCDLGWEMVEAATPETAYLTHVRLTQLRWMTGVMAPRVYRLKPVEPAGAREEMKVLFRHFEIEVDPETGKKKVVAWCPNPETGEAEREDVPGWRPPPGTVSLPA